MKETEQVEIQNYIDKQIEEKLHDYGQKVNSQLDLIKNYQNEAETLCSDLEDGINTYEVSSKNIEKLYKKAGIELSNIMDFRLQMRELHQEYKEQVKTQIENFKSQAATELKNISDIQLQAQEFHQEYKEQVETLLNSVNNTQNEAEEFYRKYKEQGEDLLGNINNAQNEAEEFYQKYKEQVRTQIENFTSQAEELCARVETLLPGATTAGLATNYKKAQDNKRWKYYWAGFLGSLVYMIIVILPLDIDIFPFNVFSLKSLIEETDPVWYHWIYRIFVISPSVWLAWYCQRNISQITRIQEEYHHKEKVMCMYEGFMREIEQLPDDASAKGIDMQSKLLNTMIETIGKNPAEVIPPSETLIEANILTKLFRKNKSPPESESKKEG